MPVEYIYYQGVRFRLGPLILTSKDPVTRQVPPEGYVPLQVEGTQVKVFGTGRTEILHENGYKQIVDLSIDPKITHAEISSRRQILDVYYTPPQTPSNR